MIEKVAIPVQVADQRAIRSPSGMDRGFRYRGLATRMPPRRARIAQERRMHSA